MSSRFKASADEMTALGGFLAKITHATRYYGVNLCPYNPISVEMSGGTIEINWDRNAEAYIVDDSVGS
jgi:hypothetical protein